MRVRLRVGLMLRVIKGLSRVELFASYTNGPRCARRPLSRAGSDQLELPA